GTPCCTRGDRYAKTHRLPELDPKSRAATKCSAHKSTAETNSGQSCNRLGVRPSSGAATLDRPTASAFSPAIRPSYNAAPEDGRTPTGLRLCRASQFVVVSNRRKLGKNELSPAVFRGILSPLMQQVNLGIIGGGTVGGGVFKALQANGALLASRLGIKIHLVKVAAKAFDEPQRKVDIPHAQITLDWKSLVSDPQVQIVAELAGGTTIAREMILAALKLGKPVITANKALLSAHGEELFAAAQQYGTNLYYEGSVAGGIPIIKALREGFVGNRITHLYGIVNGTCNYILTRMKFEGAEFEGVLKDAQAQGYAETKSSLDIDGHDALHKIGILASLAHGFWVNPKLIHVEGIRNIT